MPVKTAITIASNPFGLAILSLIMIGLGATNSVLSPLIGVGGLGIIVSIIMMSMNRS